MTDWIISSSHTRYDTERAFESLEYIDWPEVQNAHLQVDDRVFFYRSAPTQAITHVCEVVRTGIPHAETIEDRQFWADPYASEGDRSGTWMRLHRIFVLDEYERQRMTLARLKEAGLKAAPQGRIRAPEQVSELVDLTLAANAEEGADLEAEDLIAQERDLLQALGHPRSAWHPKRGEGTASSSFASYLDALDAPDAATAITMLRAFTQSAGLEESGGWCVSALPRWRTSGDDRRFATISGGQIELFFVWFSASSGLVEQWGARFPRHLDGTLGTVEGMWTDTADNGDLVTYGTSVRQLIQFLDDSEVRTAVRNTAAERARSRRKRWHNPYLAALLTASRTGETSELVEPETDTRIEFERRYVERTIQTRQHQAPLRRAALRYYAPPACHYCGLDVPQVLDTAHIIADSSGGAASMENVRLLCANHHRALDAGLLKWDVGAQRFVRAPNSVDVLPAPPDNPN